MKIYILGATGQVGQYLLEYFSTIKSFTAIGFSRTTMGANILELQGHKVVVGSLIDQDDCLTRLQDADVIINCINTNSKKDIQRFTENLAKLSRLSLYICFSSVAVYGAQIPANASFSNPKPTTEYGRAKVYLEKQTAKLFERAGKKYYLFRLGHVYGPDFNLSNELFKWTQYDFQPPSQASNCISVRCLAWLLSQLIIKPTPPSGIYNLTDNPQRTWAKIFELHEKAMKLAGTKSPQIPQYATPKFSVMSLLGSEKLKDFLMRWCSFLPESIQEKLRIRYVLLSAKSQTGKQKKHAPSMARLYSYPAPGKTITLEIDDKVREELESVLVKEMAKAFFVQSTARWFN